MRNSFIMRCNKHGATSTSQAYQQTHDARGRRIIQAARRLIDQQGGWTLRCRECEHESATFTIGTARRRTAHEICDAKFSGDRFGSRRVPRRQHLRE